MYNIVQCSVLNNFYKKKITDMKQQFTTLPSKKVANTSVCKHVNKYICVIFS